MDIPVEPRGDGADPRPTVSSKPPTSTRPKAHHPHDDYRRAQSSTRQTSPRHDDAESDAESARDARHARREQARRSPRSQLAATGLYWLSGTPERFSGVPGTWSVVGTAALVHLSPSEYLTIDGRHLPTQHLFPALEEGESITMEIPRGPGQHQQVTSLQLMRRDDEHIIRPLMADHPFLTEYAGTELYPYHPGWRVWADFERLAGDRSGPVTHKDADPRMFGAVGVVRFEVFEHTQSLLVFPTDTPGMMRAIFTDTSNDPNDCRSVRALHVAEPGPEDPALLDFNESHNLPCTYTELANCPLPPDGGRLSVPIVAGETPRPSAFGHGWDEMGSHGTRRPATISLAHEGGHNFGCLLMLSAFRLFYWGRDTVITFNTYARLSRRAITAAAAAGAALALSACDTLQAVPSTEEAAVPDSEAGANYISPDTADELLATIRSGGQSASLSYGTSSTMGDLRRANRLRVGVNYEQPLFGFKESGTEAPRASRSSWHESSPMSSLSRSSTSNGSTSATAAAKRCSTTARWTS